jgi:hypothetical protein
MDRLDDGEVRDRAVLEVAALPVEEAVVQAGGVLAPELVGAPDARLGAPAPVELAQAELVAGPERELVRAE